MANTFTTSLPAHHEPGETGRENMRTDHVHRADFVNTDGTHVLVAHHFVVRGGLIVRFEQFVDTALVRDAMTA